jgi:hypothetical protein
VTNSKERIAACHCGGLKVRLTGDPVLVSSCHCQACQRRTGALFGSTSFFRKGQLVAVEGQERSWPRAADSGNVLTFHFCPTCGSNVYWESAASPDLLSVAVGCFADPDFPSPQRTVWTETMHRWLEFPAGIPRHPRAPDKD